MKVDFALPRPRGPFAAWRRRRGFASLTAVSAIALLTFGWMGAAVPLALVAAHAAALLRRWRRGRACLEHTRAIIARELPAASPAEPSCNAVPRLFDDAELLNAVTGLYRRAWLDWQGVWEWESFLLARYLDRLRGLEDEARSLHEWNVTLGPVPLRRALARTVVLLEQRNAVP